MADRPSNHSSDSEATRVARVDSEDQKGRGRWGEQHQGEGVDVGRALKEYRQLSRQLSTSRRDAEEGGSSEGEEGRFDLAAFVRRQQAVYSEAGISFDKQLGAIWRDLTVYGVSSDAAFNKDTARAVIGSFGPDLFHFLAKKFPKAARLIPGYHVPIRPLIQGFSGSLKDEMLLVLGKPGSGCSTFLRAIANERSGFVDVTGEVSYGGISAADMARKFRGETVYNSEEDLHYPTLTVEQTLRFALANKVPGRRPQGESRKAFIQDKTRILLRMFGISHTADTMVGDAMVRGVSGGERKRVSIAESLATGGAISAWDNSTRGLDSSTALDYVKSLRILTDVAGRTNIVSLYQASENIYDLFDKVMLIDEGRMIYFGPVADARAYFEDLGYASPPRQTTPDFLTALTDPTQRLVREGYEKRAPRSPEERESAFRNSHLWQATQDDMAAFEKEDHKRVDQLKTTVRQAKSSLLPKASPYTVSLPRSLWALVERQFLLKWGDRGAFYTKTFTNVAIAFIVGSMFWSTPQTSAGAFSFGGALFFSLLFLGWLNLAEIYEAVQGRPVAARHASFAYYRPGAVALAQVICDLPLNLIQTTIWSIIFYFLAQLHRSASAFFIYYLFVFVTTIALTSFFRAVASVSPNFDTGIRMAVIGLNIGIIFVGYVIPRSDMPSWFKWISYIQPLSFAFEAVMANQFARIDLPCDPQQIVPNLPGADSAFQTCFVRGAQPGSIVVSGSAYIGQSYGYYYANVWRNFGIVLAYTIGYIAAAAIFSEVFSFANGGGASTVFIRSKRAKATVAAHSGAPTPRDEEEKPAATAKAEKEGEALDGEDDKVEGMQPSQSIFTWKNLSYSVAAPEGERQLLHEVSGWVKPGEATALMGASGAGKTTLLNTLSRRMDPTRVTGDILVDGKEPPPSFARSCGFAEQADVHDSTATVREALEFSALLRQPRDVSREEKIRYVDTIMELLDLEPLQDAIIGTPEAGLTVEQRKRVTIGVELAAKPSILSFFDEPTSGLDSNGAIAIGRFIRRLSRSGQGCLATIHQPSSVLLTTCFDRVLLLSPGGFVTYFGPVNELTRYFEGQGARACAPDENVAEYALEVVGNGEPWGERWLRSGDLKAVNSEIDQLVDERKGQDNRYADESEFSASTWTQTRMLTVRVAKGFWRDPSYAYGKLATAFLVALFTAFTFYKVGNSVAQLQQKVFAIFLIILILPAIMNASIPKHFTLRGFWQARESHSKTYNWIALLTAILVNEVPYALVMGVVYFALFYWPIGFPTGETAGLVFLNGVMLNLFVPGITHWLCALSMSPSTVANMLPLALVVLNIMNGIIQTYNLLVPPWRYFIYWANPLVYFLGSELGAVLHNVPVVCAEAELAVFDPPPGQTCGSYAGEALAQQGSQLLNPAASAGCQACQYTVGDQFLSTLNIQYSQRWRDFGIFTAFTISNFVLVYVLFYLCIVKGGAAIPSTMIGKLSSKIRRR